MSVINTNISSLISQQNLGKSQNALTTAMERLSSGLRINNAKDDAAGQAIANRFSSQISGLNQAQRNANDGISVAQTAEGGLDQINDNLQRIRVLSVQASNDTNSQEDRNSIQAEIAQRLNEIDRISTETDFNGTKVLASDQSLRIQVGADDDQVINVALEEITAQTLNLDSFNVNGAVGTTATLVAATTEDFESAFGDTTAIAESTVDEFNVAMAANLGVETTSITTTDSADAFVDEQGNWFAQLTIKAASEAEVRTLAAQGITANTSSATTFYVALDPQDADVTTGTTTATFALSGDQLTADALLSSASVDPMEQIDAAIKQVDTLRSDLGAIQNRFDSAITNLQTNETNLSAARSRIEDADYATEVANMTRAQILQQAGTSVLAQANQLPQNVLSLLG